MQNTQNRMQYLQAIKSIKYMLSNMLLFTILIAFCYIVNRSVLQRKHFTYTRLKSMMLQEPCSYPALTSCCVTMF